MVVAAAARDSVPSGIGSVPNKSLLQTGHAKDASARHYGFSRVSRLLSVVFGTRQKTHP